MCVVWCVYVCVRACVCVCVGSLALSYQQLGRKLNLSLGVIYNTGFVLENPLHSIFSYLSFAVLSSQWFQLI